MKLANQYSPICVAMNLPKKSLNFEWAIILNSSLEISETKWNQLAPPNHPNHRVHHTWRSLRSSKPTSMAKPSLLAIANAADVSLRYKCAPLESDSFNSDQIRCDPRIKPIWAAACEPVERWLCKRFHVSRPTKKK